MRRPSRNCLSIICAQAPSRPEGRAQRGRSEAQRLAQCRAQMQHRYRDGRRRTREATPKDAGSTLHATRPRDEFPQTFELQNAREDASLVDRQFREIQDQFVQENVDAIARELRGEHNALLAGLPTIADTDCDRDSHGVSDPSGRARGHLGRAHRGRSRHGFLPPLRQGRRLRAAKTAARIRNVPRATRRSL
jgi:hypothetical protein